MYTLSLGWPKELFSSIGWVGQKLDKTCFYFINLVILTLEVPVIFKTPSRTVYSITIIVFEETKKILSRKIFHSNERLGMHCALQWIPRRKNPLVPLYHRNERFDQ